MSADLPTDDWTGIARRIVEDVGVRRGELVLIRDHAGDSVILEQVMLAVEERGAVPLPENTSPDYLTQLLSRAEPSFLEKWDTRRTEWVQTADRAIKLAGDRLDPAQLPADALRAWHRATERLGEIEDERRIPSVLVALPTLAMAAHLGMPVEDLRAILLPALAVAPAELQGELDGPLRFARHASSLTIHTGEDCTLHVSREGRPWHVDDGIISDSDAHSGGHVANLPAGALYTTVIEDATEGDLWLEQAGPARNVRLHFDQGRVTHIEAADDTAHLEALFDDESGESRRISHMGIGFNPRLRRPIGWVLVDEHVQGALIVAFGENRYLGGQNRSSLNIDFCSPDSTMVADGRLILEHGRSAGG